MMDAMGLLGADALYIDEIKDRHSAGGRIYDPTGRPVADIRPARQHRLLAQRNWRVVVADTLVLTVTDPRNPGRDRFEVLDPSGARAAVVAVKYRSRDQIVKVNGEVLTTSQTTEGLSARTALNAISGRGEAPTQTVTWAQDGRVAARLTTRISVAPTRQRLDLAPDLPVRLRAVVIGSVIIRNLKADKIDTRPDLTDFF
ncbi:hypothetical protein [Acidipropionibacterium virtanenii]|nr:hypothetical protein [Acidipropionibacterium virtanenii]